MESAQFVSLLERSINAAPGSIRLADRLADVEGWDSIGALSLIAAVDSQYGITLDAGALVQCKTVADLAALARRDAGSAGSARPTGA